MIFPEDFEPVLIEILPPEYVGIHGGGVGSVSGIVISAVIVKSGQIFFPPHGSLRTVPPLSVHSVTSAGSFPSISSHFVSTAPPKALHQHSSSDAL
jgi:hypothetical protein